MPPPLLFIIIIISPSSSQPSGPLDACSLGAGPGRQALPCQPPPTNMKEFMQIRVDPPGITCGNPPERFCTLVGTWYCPHPPSSGWSGSSGGRVLHQRPSWFWSADVSPGWGSRGPRGSDGRGRRRKAESPERTCRMTLLLGDRGGVGNIFCLDLK